MRADEHRHRQRPAAGRGGAAPRDRAACGPSRAVGRDRWRRGGGFLRRASARRRADGSRDAESRRRRRDAPDHGARAVRDPDRDGERQREHVVGVRGDGRRRARCGRHADARARAVDRRIAAGAACEDRPDRPAARKPLRGARAAGAGAHARTADARRDRCVGGRADRAHRAAARVAGRFPGRDRDRPARRPGIRVRHGRMARRLYAAAGARRAAGQRARGRRGAARGDQRPSDAVAARRARLYAASGRNAVPAVDRRVLQQRRGRLAERCARCAADRHGARRRARPEGDAGEGLLHDRAGRSDQRRVRDAEGGGGDRRGVGDPAARTDRAPVDRADRARAARLTARRARTVAAWRRGACIACVARRRVQWRPAEMACLPAVVAGA
ncbi:hypothetical protein F01_420324 [Burkholderia cenocepacia]|nr:hypothetical protein F01_420324 [Burkholderia cenocepacia]